MRLYDRLATQPNDATGLYELGAALVKKGDLGRGTGFLCQAIAANPKQAEFYVALGRALLSSGKSSEAACAFRQALAVDAKLEGAYHGLGEALLREGEFRLAAAAIRVALRQAPRNALYHTSLAHATRQMGETRKAIRHGQAAVSLEPRNPGAYGSLIEALFAAGKLRSALGVGRRWLGLRAPKEVRSQAWYYMARSLSALGCPAAALRFIRQLVALQPENPQAHFSLACHLLQAGRFAEGWSEYEWRLKLPGSESNQMRFLSPLPEPMWQGEPLDGKTVLVHTEQGFGDAIQFVRFVPALARLGCRVIVSAPQPLVSLFRSVPGAAVVVAHREPIPRYDYHVSACSLPAVLNPAVEGLAKDVPYLTAPRSVRRPVPIDRKAKLRVGFVWATRPLESLDHRTLPLACLEPLFALESAAFYSFQVSDHARQLESVLCVHKNVHTLQRSIQDFADTAFFLKQMDLVLSIDTSVAHLAGALALPVWVLLPFSAEWRWLGGGPRSRGGNRSPWYPTMRLFRAPGFNRWPELVEPVASELRQVLGGARDALPEVEGDGSWHTGGQKNERTRDVRMPEGRGATVRTGRPDRPRSRSFGQGQGGNGIERPLGSDRRAL